MKSGDAIILFALLALATLIFMGVGSFLEVIAAWFLGAYFEYAINKEIELKNKPDTK